GRGRGPGREPGSAGPRRPRRGRSRARRRTGGERCRAPLAAGSPTVSCCLVYRRSGATRKCCDEGGPPSPPRGRRGLRRVSGGDEGVERLLGPVRTLSWRIAVFIALPYALVAFV